MNSFAARLCATLCLAVAFIGISPLPAQTSATPPAKTAEARKPRPIPFRGKIVAIDTNARTLTVGQSKRVFFITPETKLYKSGSVPATLQDGQVNGEVTGSYYKLDNGRLVARSVYFGGKGDSKTVPKPAKPAEAEE